MFEFEQPKLKIGIAYTSRDTWVNKETEANRKAIIEKIRIVRAQILIDKLFICHPESNNTIIADPSKTPVPGCNIAKMINKNPTTRVTYAKLGFSKNVDIFFSKLYKIKHIS